QANPLSATQQRIIQKRIQRLPLTIWLSHDARNVERNLYILHDAHMIQPISCIGLENRRKAKSILSWLKSLTCNPASESVQIVLNPRNARAVVVVLQRGKLVSGVEVEGCFMTKALFFFKIKIFYRRIYGSPTRAFVPDSREIDCPAICPRRSLFNPQRYARNVDKS